MTAGSAWYSSSRTNFLGTDTDTVVASLSSRAARDGWHIEPEQHEEWETSVRALQQQLVREVQVLQSVLSDPKLDAFETIVLEYDLRRRGLRIDCVLLGNGIIAVLEFKRGNILKAHFAQAENYCVNLIEFHAETRRLCAQLNTILVPIVVQTERGTRPKAQTRGFMAQPWHHIARPALVSTRTDLAEVLLAALQERRGTAPTEPTAWLGAAFSPSSSILDAALSLYGQHTVSAISAHAAPLEVIERCAEDVATHITQSEKDGINRVVFVSGAPGSGKTLLGLKIVFNPKFREDTVFVTGNAPLVDVLQAALHRSYKSSKGKRDSLAGYPKESAHHVIANSTFKLVKAHTFLGKRGTDTGSTDGRVVVFDEAQRTYEKGRIVLREKLEDDEAALVLTSLEKSYGKGCVVVALLGHNQFINSGEVGSGAWIHAAQRQGWRCVVANDTLPLLSTNDRDALLSYPGLRETLEHGHLPHSLRYYRNAHIEQWAATVLKNDQPGAREITAKLDETDTIWITRSLEEAKQWAREQRVGDERAGLIGSGKGARLAAEGLFVGLKPSIADWMLSSEGDVRSSNSLETIQNQFQVQGLELDYTIVCWDLDLRREKNEWASYSFAGTRWNRRVHDIEIAKNGYRVLLTRARRGMIIFVPEGDPLGVDDTRPAEEYEKIAEHLTACGARVLPRDK
jgi:hypothetical protein